MSNGAVRVKRDIGGATSEQVEGVSPSHPIVRVVDDDPALLRAVALLLRTAGLHVQVFQNAHALLGRLNEAPGCIVLDLRLPGVDGLAVQEAIARTREPLPIIFLTGRGDVRSSVQALKAGAVDFLTKPVRGHDLVAAVRRAIALDERTRVQRRDLRTLRAKYDTLTPREREVFALVVGGFLNKEIAATLATSERTVKAHRAHIMEKMAVRSVADLVRAAERLGGRAGAQPT